LTALRQGNRFIKADESDAAPPAGQIMLGREDGFGRFFGQRVPFAAIGALALPAIGNAATGLTDIAAFGFGHVARISEHR